MFLGRIDLRRDFGGIQNNLKIRGSVRVSRPRSSANKVQPNLFYILETFKAQKFGMGYFLCVGGRGGGVIFGPGIFWGFDFCLHSIIPVTWNLEYPQSYSVERAPNARISKRLLPILRTASQLLYQNFARANDSAAGYAGYVPCEQFGPTKQIITLSANTMIP